MALTDLPCLLAPLAVERHTALWQDAGSEKTSSFLEWSEPCPRAVWLVMAALLRSDFPGRAEGTGQTKDHHSSQVLPPCTKQATAWLARQGPPEATFAAWMDPIHRHRSCWYPSAKAKSWPGSATKAALFRQKRKKLVYIIPPLKIKKEKIIHWKTSNWSCSFFFCF